MYRLLFRAARTSAKVSAICRPTVAMTERRAFHSAIPFYAETTTEIPQSPPTTTTYPRSEAAALLGLDNPTNSERDAARMKDAMRESQARFAAGQSAREKMAIDARNTRNMEKLSSRKWRAGDVYTPHDLTPREIIAFNRMRKPTKDIFDALGMNPLDAYKNPVLLAEFMSATGRIKHPRETGLRPVNQRKIAKAIRRAIGMGLMPKCHVHPEMLRRTGPDGQTRKYQWQ